MRLEKIEGFRVRLGSKVEVEDKMGMNNLKLDESNKMVVEKKVHRIEDD